LLSFVIKSSAIEGAHLDAGQVRSSIARRLGLDFGGGVKASREVEGMVEMILDATQRLEWFLGCIGRAVAGAEGGLASVLRKARIWERINNQSPVNERQRTVINRLLDGFEGKLSTSKYAKLTKCSSDTALRDIRILLDRGVLIQEAGGGRNTSYRLVEPEDQPG
jgi:Fic family protein